MSKIQYYKKLKEECNACKAKFDIWLSVSNFNLDQEETIRKGFYRHCRPCKLLEEIH